MHDSGRPENWSYFSLTSDVADSEWFAAGAGAVADLNLPSQGRLSVPHMGAWAAFLDSSSPLTLSGGTDFSIPTTEKATICQLRQQLIALDKQGMSTLQTEVGPRA
jgi:hypothetical protein